VSGVVPELHTTIVFEPVFYNKTFLNEIRKKHIQTCITTTGTGLHDHETVGTMMDFTPLEARYQPTRVLCAIAVRFTPRRRASSE
jgi:hypothetical protein